MADIRVNQLPDIAAIAAGDILHILDISSTDDVDSQTTVDAIADWIIANKSVRITGIDDVPGLRAALDGKADIVHTHTVAQVIGLQADLDNKTDISQAQIIGRNIILNGNSINVPSTIGGLQDDRIPDTVVVGEYLQFGTTGGGINNITGDDLKGNLNINLVDNTTDLNKPISTATQVGLDNKVDDSVYQAGQTAQDETVNTLAGLVGDNTTAIALNTSKVSFDSTASNKLDGIESGADVTDTTNVWSSLGISGSGSTSQVLSQRGVFIDASAFNAGLLAADNTWTGANTYTDTTIFNNTSSEGSIKARSIKDLTGAAEILLLSDEIEIKSASTLIQGSGLVGMIHTTSDAAIISLPGTTSVNFSRIDRDFEIRKQTTGIALSYDAGTDTLTAGADNVVGFGGSDGGEADSIIRQAGGSTVDPMKVWTGTKAQYDALTPDPDTLYSTTDESQSSSTTVTGTANQIDVASSGTDYTVSLNTAITGAITTNTAKTGITTAQASAITANTAKVDVNALNQVGAAVLSTDSAVYLAGATRVPRRKTFSSIPLSIFNNDAGFITSGVSLAADNDWTGIQTFSNTAGIQVENIVGATEMHISSNGNEIITYDNSSGVEALIIDGHAFSLFRGDFIGFQIGDTNENVLTITDEIVSINSSGNDVDFRVRGSSGILNGLEYNHGTDTLSSDAANFDGIADQETGTWTPTFSFAGTQGATTATYSRVGNTVVASCEAVLAAGTIAFNFAVTTASLPFTTSATSLSVGTFFNAATGTVTSPVEGGTVIIVGTDLRFFDKGSTTNVKGTDLLGYISFTITYQTS